MKTEPKANQHQPKGGMCAVCTKQNRNCSGLDFESMPVISVEPKDVIVRCTDFKRETAASKA